MAASYVGKLADYAEGEDFIIFEERYEQFCVANGIVDDKVKVGLLLNGLSSDVYRTVRDLCFPDLPKSKKYSELVTVLKGHYSPQVNVFRERIQFYRAAQTGEESVTEWYYRIKRLSINCEFGASLKEILRDRFVSGMVCGPVLDRIVEEDHTETMNRLLNMATAKEMAIANSHKGGGRADIFAVRTGNRHDDGRRTSAQGRRSDRRTSGASAGDVRNGTNFNGDGTRNSSKYARGFSEHGQNQRCKCCGKQHVGTCRFSSYTCNGCKRVNLLADGGARATLETEFPDVCGNKLGLFKSAKITLQLKQDATPSHCRPYSLPLALKAKVDKELERMEARGIITPTVTAKWSSPIVPIVKSNGKVRICGNYKTLNKSLIDVFYPLPKIEQIFASMSGNVKFSKFDLSDAYMQFELDPQSRESVTISTHRGLFIVNRMPFGVKCASF